MPRPLTHCGISDDDLLAGYPGDPTSKSNLRILFRRGLLYRLTRNLDKARGFVNGALAVGYEELDGNEVFIVRLLSSGNLALVHPVEEKGQRFLPLTYGYATTVRRAQGASLDMGCIYFDQKRHAAGRGYGYVAVSRFKSREGCFLYGNLIRRSLSAVYCLNPMTLPRSLLSLSVRARVRIFRKSPSTLILRSKGSLSSDINVYQRYGGTIKPTSPEAFFIVLVLSTNEGYDSSNINV